MAQEYITDCSGRRVAVGDRRFAAKCWVGNTTDFLGANAAHVIPSTLQWELPAVSIIMPIYRSGLDFQATLESLLSQRWVNPKSIEIILYVNQPLGEIDKSTDETLRHLHTLVAPDTTGGSVILTPRHRHTTDLPRVRLIFEQLEGGLAQVYQRSFASLVARIRQNVDSRNLETKNEMVKAIEGLMTSTVFSVVDDDLTFIDQNTFQEKLSLLRFGGSVILGQVLVTEAQTGFPHWDQTLVNVINLYFRFKLELGTAVLTPRAAVVADLFHLPEINCCQPYADQIWFASATLSKNKLFVPVQTTIVQETYPSNAEMTARLAQFLHTGDDKGALDIFENLTGPFQDTLPECRYGFDDLRKLITVINERRQEDIDSFVTYLLER